MRSSESGTALVAAEPPGTGDGTISVLHEQIFAQNDLESKTGKIHLHLFGRDVPDYFAPAKNAVLAVAQMPLTGSVPAL